MSDISRCDDFWSTLNAELNQSLTAPLSGQIDGPFCTPLVDSALLRISGAQWRRFLQGQLTCNVEEATPEQALAGAYCTPKGRMVANFILICAADDSAAWLRLPADQATALRDVLHKYAVFSRVSLELESGWCGIGIHLDAAGRLPSPWSDLQPAARLGSRHAADACLVQLDDNGHRFELWTPAAQLPSGWSQLRQVLPPARPDSWPLLDIHAGLGQVQAATRELFLPQMLNLDLLGAVSFRKGCYTGQEVIARLHYRGKSKRRMYRIEGHITEQTPLPAPGTGIHNSKGQAQGEIVMAAAVDTDRFEALAVLAESQIEDSLGMADGGSPIRLLSLPYAITSGSENQ